MRGPAHGASDKPHGLETQRDCLTTAAELQLAENNLRRDEQLYREGIIGEARLRATQNSEAQAAAATHGARAYNLGEGSLNELLMARRLALEARLAATPAVVESNGRATVASSIPTCLTHLNR